MKDNEELKKAASELAQIYYNDNLTREEFMDIVSSNHPDLVSNIVFVKLMELNYRQLHMKKLEQDRKKKDLLRKLLVGYKKRISK